MVFWIFLLQSFQFNSLCSTLKIERTWCQVTGLIPFLFQWNSSASAGKPDNNHQEWEIFDCVQATRLCLDVLLASIFQVLEHALICHGITPNGFRGVFVLCCRLWLLLDLVNVEVCAKTRGPCPCPMDNSPSTLASCWQWGGARSEKGFG